MHVSLDSALGRQRRLNQVGETISSIAAPTAAYSLRSLTGGDPKVVRVRRESDNDERDFTASEVSSGALVDFVNTQAINPLDIQALTSTGRDGDFLIAKAAYSLRSLGTRQATVAATGDTVARANGKYVCQVRRNVNGDLKSFTADEVTDGTLVSFVNESFTSSLPLDVQGSAAAAYSLRNLSSSYSGNVVEVRRSSDDTTQNFTADEVTNGTLLAFVGTGGSDNGFVKTWYDQSGNSNDATQATAASQPKIVSSGALLTDGITFDGSDDVLSYLDSGTTDNASIFSVNTRGTDTTTTARPAGYKGSAANLKLTFAQANDNSLRFDGASTSTGSLTLPTSDLYLRSSFKTLTTAKDFVNGGSNIDESITLSATTKHYSIGSAQSAGSVSFNGSIKEVIFYNSDQSEDRRAIEESISGHYGITLGSFNRDGFVKTWYDQSVTTQAGDTATGNHATQATAAEQPKIVSAGALNTDGGLLFDSSNFDLGSSVSLGSAHSVFAVAKTSTAVSGLQSNLLTNATNGRGIGFYSDAIKDKAIDSDNANNNLTFSSNTNKKILSVTSDASNVNGFQNGTASSDNSKSQSLTNNNFTQIGGQANFAGTIEEIIVYLSDQTDNRTAIEANMGEHYSISGIPAFDNSVNGFVETWYDQSGNSNNAVQATASKQPKIVSAGSLLTAGITFDGSDDFFLLDNVLTGTNSNYSVFSVSNYGTSSGGHLLSLERSSSDYVFIFAGRDGGAFQESSGSAQGTAFPEGSESLKTILLKTADAEVFINGSNVDDNLSFTQRDSGNVALGARVAGNQPMLGSLKEIIIYASDQSSNRSALETNINGHYSIF